MGGKRGGGDADEDGGVLIDFLVLVIVDEMKVFRSSSAVEASFRLRRFFFFPSLLPDVTARKTWCRTKG
jgi:hypothetical protein